MGLGKHFEAEELERRPATVSELNEQIKIQLERGFATVWVEGEITNFHSASSGHWYFSLTDGQSLIKAACFRGQNFRIKFKPSDGLTVRCRGRVSVFEKRSEYQLIVESLEPVGEGALAIAFEQIKARLSAEGLFDSNLKRAIPKFPKRVGIITSPTGAAIHDILNVLTRRVRGISIMLIPTLVQGEQAADQIVRAIVVANRYNKQAKQSSKIDVLIVGRGGGSAEDLWAFNQEEVARAIRASEIPIISAVGHEIDFTIADFAADLRAPTPSAAAELVATAEAEISEKLSRLENHLKSSIRLKISRAKEQVHMLAPEVAFLETKANINSLKEHLNGLARAQITSIERKLRDAKAGLLKISSLLSPQYMQAKVRIDRRRLDFVSFRARAAAPRKLVNSREALERIAARLESLSPLSVLTRGYSIVQKENGTIVRSTKQVDKNEKLNVRLAEGSLTVEVVDKP
ncbi:MAG TPA: exodeoxyribonuclease VII large subunit [Pyrinomonadaceae bacterium]|nr:exodeoxyribonuclease VII large subunit [Pyrinomonadaceae bacterium]